MAYTIDSLWTLMTFTVVMTVTPGPNNLLLLSSGLKFGLYRTSWHMLGILSGVLLQIYITGAGLGALFTLFPEIQFALKIIGSLYMIWLAGRLWRAGELHATSTARPIGFTEALLFQFINPKAWIMATTVISVFVPAGQQYMQRVVTTGIVFTSVAVPCIFVWAASGAVLRAWIQTWMQSAAVMLRINRGMASLSAATAMLFWV